MDCTIITPVGPGHMDLAQQALQSVIAASQEPGPFELIHMIVGDDTKGIVGRSRARNRMVQGAAIPDKEGNIAKGAEPWMMVFSSGDDQERAFTSEWLFFLDADDLMCSPFTYGESAFKAVEPYVEDYDCIWGNIYELHADGTVLKRKQVGRITTYDAYVKTPAALSCQMGHFVRRDKFLNFNDELDVCEDVDLYLREWKELRCIKQEAPLFLNRRGQHTWMQPGEGGRQRHTGREWSMRAAEMLKEAQREME